MKYGIDSPQLSFLDDYRRTALLLTYFKCIQDLLLSLNLSRLSSKRLNCCIPSSCPCHSRVFYTHFIEQKPQTNCLSLSTLIMEQVQVMQQFI